MARFVARLGASALKQLVEQDPVPHTVFDLRPAEQQQANPLPSTFSKVSVATNPSALATCLKDAQAWSSAFPNGPAAPSVDHTLVFITQAQADFEAAASNAVKHNFQRCMHSAEPVAAVAAATVPAPAFINRDAAAHLLNLRDSQAIHEDLLFIDVRRHDERAMYGGIPGSLHIPTETLAFALQGPPERFEEQTHVPAPDKDALIVIQCRSNRRAGWIANLAQEHGYKRVLVYKQGSYGWRLDPDVQAYASYEAGDEPPVAEQFEVEKVDVDVAAKELRELGIL